VRFDGSANGQQNEQGGIVSRVVRLLKFVPTLLHITTLELDISRLGGRVTRTQLKKLVVEEVDHKRWIFNPVVEAIRDRLTSELGSTTTGCSDPSGTYRLH
jgi:hypothetical protein